MKKLFLISLISSSLILSAQSIDKIEAIIGEEIVLTSDIESQYIQYLSQGNLKSKKIRCEIIEDILFQKLLINQAKMDSIVVTDEDVEVEIYKRLDYFEHQLGNIEKVEEYFGKSKTEIEMELGKVIHDQFLAQKMQNSISNNITVTPSEVKEFFSKQDKESIPLIPTKVEVSQIIIKPIISKEQKEKIREKLNNFRERVYKGEDFKMFATLYSDDRESAKKGGELGFVNRGDLVPEFERAAFRLKKGEISEVIESEFGFHIVQLIERRGEQINVRHILIRPKINSTALNDAKIKTEKIAKEIKDGIITFDNAVIKYSDDKNKNNGGLLLNPNTMSTLHTIDEISPSLKYIIERLNINEVSSPSIIQTDDKTEAYQILRINSRIDSHMANIVDDFSMIKELTVNMKKQNALMMWIQKKIEESYVKINNDILDCNFRNKWKK